jgi:dipeptidyl aminopeptidase/acylaminoacyl peptidase
VVPPERGHVGGGGLSGLRDFGDPGWRAWDSAERAWLWKGEADGLPPTTPIPIEDYEGPLFLAVGLEDQVWSAEKTRRLEMRRRAHGRSVEAIYYENEGHALGNDAENDHYDQLIAFLRRTLGGED